MSVYSIDPKKTKEFKNRGVTWWSNPAVNVIISCKGDVERADGRPIKKYSKNDGSCAKFGVSSTGSYSLRSFNSLFVHMVKGCEYGAGKQLIKVNENLDYSNKNTRIVSRGVLRLTQADVDCEEEVKVCKVEEKVHIYKHYRVIKGDVVYKTEDGAVFPTEELAKWHQNRVSKGKGNAQVVLDYNDDYVLAEQIYLQEVVYNKKKPYVIFADVMSNNNGVVSDTKDDEYKFTTRSIPSDLIYRTAFSFERLNNFVCDDKEYATKLNNKINSMVLVYKSFVGVSEDIVSLIK